MRRHPLLHADALHPLALLLAACLALALHVPFAFGQTRPALKPLPHPLHPAQMAGPAAAPAEQPPNPADRPIEPLARPVVPPMMHQAVTFEMGGGKVVTLRQPASNIFVADPKVAEVRPGSATILFVFGTGVGRTTIAALDDAGNAIAELDVTVQPAETAARTAQAGLSAAIPGTRIRVRAVPKGLMATGTAANPAEAARAMTLLKGYVGEGQKVDDQIAVAGPIQVTLRVRIAEVSRSVTRNLGFNWQALGNVGVLGTIGSLPTAGLGAAASTLRGGASIGFNGVIDMLAQDNLARVLAEPNLTVMSGQTASFLAGGEFPIPIGQQNGQVTIAFKKYGVNLSFLPVVENSGRINLKVTPEVSQLTTQGAVQLSAGNSTIQIPALTTRQADTTIELGSGQSFAIAGLLQDNVTQSDNGLPGLGDLPVIGTLFRSDHFLRNETELVIIVTPYIVRPVDDPAALRIAGNSYTPPSDFERILRLRQVGSASPVPSASLLPGQAGFIMQ